MWTIHTPIRQVEITEEIHEGTPVIKVTGFVGGRDVLMFRFDSLTTMLEFVRRFMLEREDR
jgi:hypothetical protein